VTRDVLQKEYEETDHIALLAVLTGCAKAPQHAEVRPQAKSTIGLSLLSVEGGNGRGWLGAFRGGSGKLGGIGILFSLGFHYRHKCFFVATVEIVDWEGF